MLCKSLGKHCSLGDDSNQCIIYRKCNPKTFSSFVDNVIRELPETIASRQCPMDTSNPLDVLKSKGLLNCRPSTGLHRDCSSDVTLNFYSEELRGGEPVKIFASNHHFKHGKLIYSSTHEILPDRRREIDRSIDWMKRRQRSLSDRRRWYRRSLSPVNLSDMENKKSERYLHTLRSNRIRQPVSPRPFSCHITKYKPVAYQDHPAFRESSEISISSRQSWICSSPKQTIEETSAYDKKYKYTRISPPKPKLKREFFVIPKHTCHKVPHIDRYESRWNTVSKFICSPGQTHEQDYVSYRVRNKECRKTKSFEHDMKVRRAEDTITAYKNGRRKTSQIRNPLKGILTTKHEGRSKISPPQPRIRFHDDTIYSKEKMHREKHKIDNSGRNKVKLESRHKHRETEMSEDEKYDVFEQGKRQESFRSRDATTSAESETESDSSSRTAPFLTSKDSEHQRGMTRQISSDTSATSICSIRHNDQINAIGSSQKNFKRSTDHQLRGDQRKYHKQYKEQSYEHGETSTGKMTSVKSERDIIREESKHSKKRRQINPNKIVHIEDDGKRLSQYYSNGKVTLDSEKAFEDEEKIHSKKIQFYKCSPKRTGTTYKFYSEQSLEDYLKRVLVEDHQENLRLIEKVINKEALAEYKKKYANFSTNSSKKKFLRSTEIESRDEYEITNNTRCNSDDCDACVIERLLGE